MNKKAVYSLLIVVLVVFIGTLALLATTSETTNLLTGNVVLDTEEKTFANCMNIEAQKLTEYTNIEKYCSCKAEAKQGCALYLQKKRGANKCAAGYLPEYICELTSKQKPTLKQRYQYADCKTKYVPVKECHTACAENKCADEACTETDKGNDPYMAGTITGNDKFDKLVTYSDLCANADGVREFYCKNDKVADIYYACSFGCDAAKGECRKAVCTDTDDGQSIYARGTTTGGVFGEPVDVKTEKQDNCVNANQLREYYCHETGAVSSIVVDCANGCVDRKCNVPKQK